LAASAAREREEPAGVWSFLLEKKFFRKKSQQAVYDVVWKVEIS
jgi:hypothetical protein